MLRGPRAHARLDDLSVYPDKSSTILTNVRCRTLASVAVAVLAGRLGGWPPTLT